mgnify:CR=1 FL=1
MASKKIAFLVAPEGIEQVELTEPWKAVTDAGHEAVLVSTESGEVQMFNHLDKGDTRPVDQVGQPGEKTAVAPQIHAGFFQCFPLGSGPCRCIFRLQAAARESHVARPGVTLPTGPLDKEQLLATVFCASKDKGDGRSGESAPKRYLVGAQMA